MRKKSPNFARSLLYPFSLIYGFIVFVRNRLFDYNLIKSEEFNIPVVSVGNITVGGTGKTPHIEYLISVLKDHFKIAVLSRGYKRKTKNFILATNESDSNQIGDEPKQIKQKFPDVHVAVENKRVKGINALLDKIKDLNVILLDDAFQHRYVKPGLSLLLIDYNHPISEDHLLPCGNLREQSYEKRRANIIMITKSPTKLKPIERRLVVKYLKLFPYQTLFFTTITYGKLEPVFNIENPITDKQCKEDKYSILLVTGIADPRPFKKHIRSLSPKIEHMIFSDHRRYSDKDAQNILTKFNSIDNKFKIIITTEKDAMRLQDHKSLDDTIKSSIYFIPIGIDFLNDDTENFNNLIINYVKKNKRDSILYSK